MRGKKIFFWSLLILALAASAFVVLNLALPPSPSPVSFETIEKGSFGGIKENKTYVITSEGEWKSLWAQMGRAGNPPQIVFSQEMAIAVFQGEKPTGGYSIEIESAAETGGGAIEVFVNSFSPGKNCVVSQAVTSPYDIARIRKAGKEIAFRIKNEVRNCG